ncbi:MAG: ATP-binding protein [Nitrospirota bacterium]
MQSPIRDMAGGFKKSLAFKYLIFCGFLTTVTISLLTLFFVGNNERIIYNSVENEARALFKQLVITRRWIADHGGVFVEKLPWVKPNPYLSGKDAEITDIKGRVFVKASPAMVTKDLSRYTRDMGGYWFHITSLKLMNPENAPDAFEKESLSVFEQGAVREISRMEKIDNLHYLRYIAPLYIESACLDCHAKHGYRIGDVRGAISVSMPVENVLSQIKQTRRYAAFAALLTIVLLTASLYLIMNRLFMLPVRRMNSHIREFMPKSCCINTVEGSGDELDELASSLKEMVSTIKEYHFCMEEKIKSAVSDLEDTNIRLMEANKKLLDIDKRKSDFVAKVSHELRTPLTSIKGAMDYISARLQSVTAGGSKNISIQELKKLDDLLAFFDIIKNNSERLIRMVNDILDLERIEQGNAEMHFTEIDMAAVIDETVKGISASSAERGIGIHVEAEIGALVRADEDRIKQVIINLISNAIEYSPVNSDIQIKVLSKDGSAIVIVKDNGPGIPKEEQERIFDRFYTIGSKKGTGLGLAISKGIIEAHGGIIGIVSDSHSGSSFYLKLPLAAEATSCKT